MNITIQATRKIKKVMYHNSQAPPQQIQLSSTLILTLNGPTIDANQTNSDLFTRICYLFPFET